MRRAIAIAPARAEGPVSACHWIDREYSATYTCEEPAETVAALELDYDPAARRLACQATSDGLPRYTLSRGQVAVREGMIETVEGHGEFVPRPAGAATGRALSTWKALTNPQPVQRSGIPVTGV